jgi:hypothetical protein
LHEAVEAVEAVRESHGFRPDDELKFQTNSRPKHAEGLESGE